MSRITDAEQASPDATDALSGGGLAEAEPWGRLLWEDEGGRCYGKFARLPGVVEASTKDEVNGVLDYAEPALRERVQLAESDAQSLAELQGLVAEQIFGRCKECFDLSRAGFFVSRKWEGSSVYVGDEGDVDPLTNDRTWYCVPHKRPIVTPHNFAEDMNDAGLVVDAMGDMGWSLMLWQERSGEREWVATFTSAEEIVERGTGVTPPLAICHAALLAVPVSLHPEVQP